MIVTVLMFSFVIIVIDVCVFFSAVLIEFDVRGIIWVVEN